MRLILDQGVPRDAASLRRTLGYDCIHVSEIGMSKAADEEILAFSLGRNGVVVTLDADFHTILAVSGASGPSVIRLRFAGSGCPRNCGTGSQGSDRFRSRSEAWLPGHH